MNSSANDLATQVSFERPTQDYETKARTMGEHAGESIENVVHRKKREGDIYARKRAVATNDDEQKEKAQL